MTDTRTSPRGVAAPAVAIAVTGGLLTVAAQVKTNVPDPVPGARPAIVERIKIHGKALDGNLEGDAVDRDAIVFLPPAAEMSITPVDNAAGYPGSPYFKITIAGTERALAATADAELAVVPAFSGGPDQLWRI